MPRKRLTRLPGNAREYVEELRRNRLHPFFAADFEQALMVLRRHLRDLGRESELDKWEALIGEFTDCVAADFARQIDLAKSWKPGSEPGEPPAAAFYPDAAPTGVGIIDAFIRDQAMRLVDARDDERSLHRDLRRQKDKFERHMRAAERHFAKADRIKLPDIATLEELETAVEAEASALPALAGRPPLPADGGPGPVISFRKIPSVGKRPKRVRWEGTPEETKAVMMARAIDEGGQGLAITVNLTDDVVVTAKGRTKTLAQQLQDRISKLLKRRFGRRPDFFFVLERDQGGQPHFHGVIDLPNDKDAIKSVRAALLGLGGATVEVSTLARKVNVQSLYQPSRWGSYPFKRQATTRLFLGTKQLLSATKGLRKRGEATFKAARKAALSSRG